MTAIIASYNHREFVEAAIKSVALQDYKNIEIVVIDDGSTDGSDVLLDDLKEKYKFTLIKKKNGGIVSVINVGIGVASGDYVFFHASDDESLSSRVSQQVAVLEEFRGACFVSSNIELQRHGGGSAGFLRPVDHVDRLFSFEDLFLGRASVSSVGSMYRLENLRAIGGLDEGYYAEDPQIFWRLTCRGVPWVQSSRDPVIRYRMIFSSQSRARMHILCEQLIGLVKEFSWHSGYKEALNRAWASYFFSLTEVDRWKAISVLVSGNVRIFSWPAFRGVVKLVLPGFIRDLFKKAGRRVRA